MRYSYVIAVLIIAFSFTQPVAAQVLCGCTAQNIVGWSPAAPTCAQALSTADTPGSTIVNPVSAVPNRYFEHTFTIPTAGQYYAWARLSAAGNNKYSDSVYMQFDNDIGTPNNAYIFNLATDATGTSLNSMGWTGAPYWNPGPGMPVILTAGTHRLRVQEREDGVTVDQVTFTLSPTSPGVATNDTNRLACTLPASPPTTCSDPAATNVGGPLPCTYPAPITTCTDPKASNNGGTLPCVYPPPPPPSSSNGADVASIANTMLDQLRVMNWNVRQGYNKINNLNTWSIQTSFLAQLNPDIIAISEMSYSDGDMMGFFINDLTQRTGKPWHGYYQRGNTETDPHTNNVGLAMLTYLPVDSVRQNLDTTLSEQFMMMEFQVTVNNTKVHVASTHLYAWDAAIRQPQLKMLQTWASTAAHRMVIGDFNANPTDPTWTPEWRAAYQDAWVVATNTWTQTTNDPGFTFDKRTQTGVPERIDYQWIAGMTMYDMALVKTRRSDHHALIGTYSVP